MYLVKVARFDVYCKNVRFIASNLKIMAYKIEIANMFDDRDFVCRDLESIV